MGTGDREQTTAEPAAGRGERTQQDRAQRERGHHERVQQALDDALADSFPASDPVSIVTSQHEECWDAECGSP